MKSSRLLFPLFLLITLITFYPTIGSGFVFDFLGWQRVYDMGSFKDIIHCFGYKGNHQVLHFFFYSIYRLFHIQGLPWYLIFCSLHAFNGWLIYKLLIQITGRWKISVSHQLITLICILFLIHPYNVEVVVWKVCIHYLLSLSGILGILLLTPKYITEGNKKSLWIILLLFTLSLFALEVSFVTPVMVMMVCLVEWIRDKSTWSLRRIALLSGSMWGLLIGNLLLNRWTLGTWVGHYGAKSHLNLDVIGMMSTEIKYLVKHLFYARFYSFKTKGLLFDQILSNPELVFFTLTICMALIILYFIKIKKLSGYWHLAFFGIAGSMLYTLPISNMFFYHLQIGMNDRYSYIPLAFFLIAILALFSKLPKWISNISVSVLILISLYLQEKTTHYWHQSTEVVRSLRDKFHWHDNSHVFILNSPDNLNGIIMTSIIEAPSGIDELIDYQTDKPYNGIMYDVFQFNMTTPNDGVKVEQTGPMQLKVTFKQWGNWWHYSGIGASSYENEYYKAETLEYPYLLTFKKFPEGSVILYQDGMEWKEFKLEVSSE